MVLDSFKTGMTTEITSAPFLRSTGHGALGAEEDAARRRLQGLRAEYCQYLKILSPWVGGDQQRSLSDDPGSVRDLQEP